jgi:hypothetical protein
MRSAVLFVLVLGACVDKEPKRWFSGDCSADVACSTGLCIDQHCAVACVGAGADCGEGAVCFDKKCQPVAHACQKGLCDDANQCTQDACKPGTATCTHDLAKGPCSDQDACTAGDECLLKDGKPVCKGADKCDDGSATPPKCDAKTGMCATAVP